MRGRPFILLVLALALAGARPAAALAPHELLLAVNQNSPRSLELANRYAALRGLPPENILYLDLPASVLAPAAELSTNDFARLIAQPLDDLLRTRGLYGRILGVAYSCDLPVRVTAAPALSLTGATFVRGRYPASGLVATGLYASAFFAGPTSPGGDVGPSRSLGWFRDSVPPPRLLPLPAMLLGHAGARGLELDEIIQALDRADRPFAQPWQGAFLLHTNSDLRSRMRDWQFAAAQAELAALGAPACITNAPPAAGAPVLGYLTGTAWPAPPVCAFAPGAYADHCTSFAAHFDGSDQLKLTLWLRAGATLSSGTVVEPYSVWTKFPNARFFAHQVRGCSALECFALSVRCPLQLLPVGDPLAAPGAPRFAARLVMNATGARLRALLTLRGVPTNAAPRYTFLLDGRELEHNADRPGIVLDTAPLADGCHRLTGVASLGAELRFTAQATETLVLNAGGRMPGLAGVAAGARVAGAHPLRLSITAPAEAREVGLMQGARLLARGPARALTLDPARLGAGPVELQPVAWYADGRVSRGEPVAFEVLRIVPPPEPAGFQPLEKFDAVRPLLGQLEPQAAGVLAFSTTNAFAVAAVPAAATRELAVTLMPAEAALTHAARAGLAFNIRDARNFDFFGLVGETSGWTLAHVRDGQFHVVVARGWPVRAGKSYRLGVRAAAPGCECLLDREVLFAGDALPLEAAPAGLAVSGPGARFSGLARLPAPAGR